MFLAECGKLFSFVALQWLAIEIASSIAPRHGTDTEILRLKLVRVRRNAEPFLKIDGDGYRKLGGWLQTDTAAHIGGYHKPSLKIDACLEINIGCGDVPDQMRAIGRLDADSLGSSRIAKGHGGTGGRYFQRVSHALFLANSI